MSLARWSSVLLVFSLFLGACTSAFLPTASPTGIPATYPAQANTPTAPQSGIPYPYPYPADSTPPVEPTRDPSHVPFRLNKPITAGATQVSGTGTAGVPVSLQDVTFMGTLLAQTVIRPDGTFVFQLAAPLEAKHRLGIMVDNLAGTKFKPEDFYAPDYFGDEAMQLPQIGFYYDTAMVQAKP